MTATPATLRHRPSVDRATPVLSVDGLDIDFELPAGRYSVVEDVSLSLSPGERVALVGESGSGKTVTSLAMLRLLPQMADVRAKRLDVVGHDVLGMAGRDLDRIRGRDVAMVFQDPMSSLNPVLRVERQLTGPIRRHLGLGRDQARARALELLRAVGIPEPDRCLRAYPHELSGGMRQRVMIAMALSCEPRLLLADEPTTALDVTIQAQIIHLLTQLADDLGLACLLVTHDLGVVARFAHRVAVMYAGRIVEEGPVEEIFGDPQHPYTRALLASIPDVDQTTRLSQIDGAPPTLAARGEGCAFAPRCPERTELCDSVRPSSSHITPVHHASCHSLDGSTPSTAEVMHNVG